MKFKKDKTTYSYESRFRMVLSTDALQPLKMGLIVMAKIMF